MCISELYSFDADRREAIARVENLRRMRDVTLEWRAHYRSMSAAAGGSVTPPCAEVPAADAYQGQAA